MLSKICLATNKGILLCQPSEDGWQVKATHLEDHHATCLAIDNNTLWAGTTDSVHRSGDAGSHWDEVGDGLTLKHVRWLAASGGTPRAIFAGTEPAGIFVLPDGSDTWTDRPEIFDLRDKLDWMLPYSPEAGCVRGFAFHGRRWYAAVEVGGVLRSDDGGGTWDLVEGSAGRPDLGRPPESFVYPDVHDVAVHPSDANLLFAPTGGGLYRSTDAGLTWALLYDSYCRAVWLDPDDPNHVILGPADYVGAMGRIEQTRDGGHNWTLVSDGLEVPWRHAMPERLTLVGDTLFCILDDGRLLAAPLATLQWQFILPEAGRVNALAGIN